MRLSVVAGLAAVLFGAGPAAAAAPPTYFSLQNEPDYNLLRSCGKTCMWANSNYWIGGTLGCPSPYANDCMCRLDLAPVISTHATSCLETLCTVGSPTEDIKTFLSLYNSYCKKNGYTLPGAVAAETNPPAVTTIGEPTAATITRVTVATVTSPPSSGGTTNGGDSTVTNPGAQATPQKTVDITSILTVKPPASTETGVPAGELSRSDKIALGVGIGIGLPSAIAGIAVCFFQIMRR